MSARFAILTAHGDVVSEHTYLADACKSPAIFGGCMVVDRKVGAPVRRDEINYWVNEGHADDE